MLGLPSMRFSRQAKTNTPKSTPSCRGPDGPRVGAAPPPLAKRSLPSLCAEFFSFLAFLPIKCTLWHFWPIFGNIFFWPGASWPAKKTGPVLLYRTGVPPPPTGGGLTPSPVLVSNLLPKSEADRSERWIIWGLLGRVLQ